MKPTLIKASLAATVLLSTFNLQPSTVFAATTIDAANKYAYGANIGWMNWYADGANGAVIGAYVCFGYIYSANVGWINLCSRSPANRIGHRTSVPSPPRPHLARSSG